MKTVPDACCSLPWNELLATLNLDMGSRVNILVLLVRLSLSESLSLSRTCVSNQAAIETSGSIIGSFAALCVTKQSISSLSLQIEFISSDPVECSFLRVLHDVHENSCLSGSPAVPLLLCLGPRPPGCFGLGRERVLLVFVSAFLNLRRGLFGFVLLILRVRSIIARSAFGVFPVSVFEGSFGIALMATLVGGQALPGFVWLLFPTSDEPSVAVLEGCRSPVMLGVFKAPKTNVVV
ncbi:hypothetical protein F2Q68_00014339 [Brassica cretica]|uniref:Uncharacterized protein n=1 Tax=Brassica cretica TaxID=69181 RepID=A0A8S9HE47_BRACR|nr:hypothetical protein F2Q68_00014339 [Brassica cretica]